MFFGLLLPSVQSVMVLGLKHHIIGFLMSYDPRKEKKKSIRPFTVEFIIVFLFQLTVKSLYNSPGVCKQ